MIRARATCNTEPYTAKNTLDFDFIEHKFVKTNANTAHIAWSNKYTAPHQKYWTGYLSMAGFIRSVNKEV